MNDEFFMREALVEAQKTLDQGGLPVGAVLVLDGEIVARGHKNIDHFHMGHAEHDMLYSFFADKEIRADKKMYTMYSTLEPCAMCFGCILHCPISRLVYAMEDPWGGTTDMSALPPRHLKPSARLTVEKGVLREESRSLLKQFIQESTDRYWSNQDNIFVKTILNT